MATTRNLGDILLEKGVIDRESLDKALRLQNRRLGEILIEENLADPALVSEALKHQALTGSAARKSVPIDLAAIESLLFHFETLEHELAATQNAATRSGLIFIRQTLESLLVQPIEALVDKARMSVEQTALVLKKNVVFYSDGASFLIDAQAVADLQDAIVHLAKNAVDHGIESKDERLRSGKKTQARIGITVHLKAGKVVLRFEDDGRGLDAAQIYAKAEEKALPGLKPQAQMTEDEIFRLLFVPGFSTASEVTAISGRGIGLDIVEASVARLGGNIEVQSTVGQGTAFELSLPLRYVRAQVLPVRRGSEWFVVDSSSVKKIESGKSVEFIDGHIESFDEVGSSEHALLRASVARLTNGSRVPLLDN